MITPASRAFIPHNEICKAPVAIFSVLSQTLMERFMIVRQQLTGHIIEVRLQRRSDQLTPVCDHCHVRRDLSCFQAVKALIGLADLLLVGLIEATEMKNHRYQ